MDVHLSRFRGSVASCLFVAASFLLSATAQAEPLLTASPLPSAMSAPAVVLLGTAEPVLVSRPARNPEADRLKRLKILFIATEVLDAHSTLSALRGDASESNAVMRPLTGSTAVFVAVKAAATWVTLKAADRMATRNRKGAAWLLGASSVALSVIAVRNYQIR